jgi:hypothetical protein
MKMLHVEIVATFTVELGMRSKHGAAIFSDPRIRVSRNR